MENPKYIEYDGLRFCRDEKTGYYLNSTIRKRIHRYVWEKEVGTIPKGCQIHHINGNKADNRIENLALMTASGHLRMHGQEQSRKEKARQNMEEKVRPLAIEWHKSTEGREWHKEHFDPSVLHVRTVKICKNCGKEYDGLSFQQYCSNACKSAARRKKNVDNISMVCQMCGKEFSCNKYQPQKFCSHDCAHKAHIGWKQRKMS